jgi:hypothetical protein
MTRISTSKRILISRHLVQFPSAMRLIPALHGLRKSMSGSRAKASIVFWLNHSSIRALSQLFLTEPARRQAFLIRLVLI